MNTHTLEAMGTKSKDVPDKTQTAKTADTEQPSKEMLEFLGAFETESGAWLDPIKLEYMIPENTEKGR